MNQEPEQSKDHVETIRKRSIFDGRYVVLLILGILFTLGWLAAGVVFGFALGGIVDTSIGNGNSIPDGWIICIVIVQLIGLVSLTIAGIPAGAAFFCRRHRQRLLSLFGWFLVAGCSAMIFWFLLLKILSYFYPL
ncbi:MAG: hypothetical protein VYE64_11970 [Planctomycetota bacterium]|nr:hypothetical protein [Planctomycetota bacterium]